MVVPEAGEAEATTPVIRVAATIGTKDTGVTGIIIIRALIGITGIAATPNGITGGVAMTIAAAPGVTTDLKALQDATPPIKTEATFDF